MKKMIFFLIIFPVFLLPAQEIPVAETEDTEDAEVEISDDSFVNETSVAGDEAEAAPLTESVADGSGAETEETDTGVFEDAETDAVDDALVWDSETGEGEEMLTDSAAATVDVPILRRAEHAARKEWETISGIVNPTEAVGKLILAVLTDIRVKEIRINENSELGKTKKKIQLNFLRYEKNSRLKAVLDRQQFKLYREWEKAESE